MNGPSESSNRPWSATTFDVYKNTELAYKDAIFLSTHKFVGGPGSSGLLIAKKNLLFDKIPDRVGGGPVFFVNELDHEFVANVEELEEAGTPGVLQDIKAGLVFQLKENVGADTIREKEHALQERALARLSQIPNLFLLGNNKLPKVAIFTFIVKSRFGKILHPNFVTSLLNDLFGIQTRSGCSCSAMYGQKILGIELQLSREYKEALFEGHELMRMGFTRFNLNYFMTDEETDYVLDAIEFVCKFGWMFLPAYKFDVDLGIWINRSEQEQQHRLWLGEIDYSQGFMSSLSVAAVRQELPFRQTPAQTVDFSHFISKANEHLVSVVDNYKTAFGKSYVDQMQLIPEELQKLVWWLFPSQVLPELIALKKNITFEVLKNEAESEARDQSNIAFSTPFYPKDYNRHQFKFEFSTEYIGKQDEQNEKEKVEPTEEKPTEAENVEEEKKEEVKKVSGEQAAEEEKEEEEDNFFADFEPEEQVES